jgi:hypothetical protein
MTAAGRGLLRRINHMTAFVHCGETFRFYVWPGGPLYADLRTILEILSTTTTNLECIKVAFKFRQSERLHHTNTTPLRFSSGMWGRRLLLRSVVFHTSPCGRLPIEPHQTHVSHARPLCRERGDRNRLRCFPEEDRVHTVLEPGGNIDGMAKHETCCARSGPRDRARCCA